MAAHAGSGTSWFSARPGATAGRRPVPQPVVTGVGGKQIIAEHLSGNPVQLFESALLVARLSPA